MKTEGKELLLKIDPTKNLNVHTSHHTADEHNAACIFLRILVEHRKFRATVQKNFIVTLKFPFNIFSDCIMFLQNYSKNDLKVWEGKSGTFLGQSEPGLCSEHQKYKRHYF